MVYRARQAGNTTRAVLFWDGETDFQNNVSSNTWYSNYTLFSSNVNFDLGCKVMPCTLEWGAGFYNGSNTWYGINSAITNSWASDPNTAHGPNISDLIAEDPVYGLHLISDSDMNAVAYRFSTNINHYIYGN